MLRLKRLPLLALAIFSFLPVQAGSLSWIWSTKTPGAEETVSFRRDFEVPDNVVSATISSSADNWHRVWINGHLLGKEENWQKVTEFNIKPHLKLGSRNVIAVEAGNQGGAAGFAMLLQMELPNQRLIKINTDETWSFATTTTAGWEKANFNSSTWQRAVVIEPMGRGPWGALIVEKNVTTAAKNLTIAAPLAAKKPAPAAGEVPAPSPVEDMTNKFKVAPGFRLEKLYDVPKPQGSWVSITLAENGSFICADQYGKLFQVRAPEAGKPDQTTQVTPLNAEIGGAHGLLWFQGALYVTVNESVGGKAGVYRLADENKDGVFETPVLLKEMQGRGEHGPHSLVPSPDGKWIYFIAGNHTNLAPMDASMPNTAWQEDQLLPRQPDPNGHARDRMAPGGWISRFTPDGKKWELVSMGYRNPYDLAFNLEGELFTYDADMEWDIGTPWYRPTRINHAIPGSEFGWRNGSGKWPAYYEDSLGEVVDIGPGCPTGLLSGKGAKFPEKYQRAIYALDWTFATLYVIHLTAEGSGYTGKTEELIAGEGLPLSDAIIGADGHMYFTTGGRRTASAFWRVSYVGKESTAPAKPLAISKEMDQRRAFGEITLTGDASKLEALWQQLGSSDRTMRYAARVALEKIPAAKWSSLLEKENDPWRVIHASMALARLNAKDLRATGLSALDRLDWAKLTQPQQINLLRATGLWAARTGEFSAAEKAKIFAKVDSAYPAQTDELNRELCRLLSYMQAPGVVARTLALMDQAKPTPIPNWAELASRNGKYGSSIKKMLENSPPLQNTFYAYCLRAVKGPWKAGERERFFSWIGEAAKRSGGNSYIGFLNATRNEALANGTEAERKTYGKDAQLKNTDHFANLPPIKGPGRNWTVEEVEKITASGLTGRNIENGKKMYQASLCAACHVIGTEGGAAGPQLNALGGRFSVRDIAEAIIDPGKVVSDQYAFSTIEKNDGSTLVGKIVDEKDGKLIVAMNPFDMQQHTEIAKADVKSTKASVTSPMPPALINRLNEEELKDLLAFLLGK
jgi:putative heme-binding domain-containing protein